jgi:threonine dehydrogenase-like Zn-dependent dehydrogenase
VRALTIEPGKAGSADVREVPDPERPDDELLVEGLALGVCGTDKEIARGQYGWAPPGRDRLILGHESLGRVLEAPTGSGFEKGQLVAGVVRRKDPIPCGACAHDEWDMCRNGQYTERGIKEVDGYCSERWAVPASYAVGVDSSLGITGVLTEPTSVVAKAWEQVDRVGDRAWFEPHTVLVTGSGPIGLLAAMLGVQRGLDVHVLDVVTEGVKPELVDALGATYHHQGVAEVAAKARPDVIVEATGVGEVIFDALVHAGTYGVVCLTGVSPIGKPVQIDAGAINRDMVLENLAVVGSVNANLRHYRAAAEALDRADQTWLRRLITRTVALDDAPQLLAGRAEDGFQDDVKVVIALGDEGARLAST